MIFLGGVIGLVVVCFVFRELFSFRNVGFYLSVGMFKGLVVCYWDVRK